MRGAASARAAGAGGRAARQALLLRGRAVRSILPSPFSCGQALPLEDVERLMQDSADAKAYEDSLRQMLGE